MPDLVHVIDLGSSPDSWSAALLTGLLDWAPEQLQERTDGVRTLVHPDDLVLVDAGAEAVRDLTDGEVVESRVRLLHVAGGYRWILRRATPLSRGDDGTLLTAVATARDITPDVEHESQLARAALHDPLTGLPNRDLLLDRLDTALLRRRRSGQVVPVLFCDLDGFKGVNDTGGHQAGDAVLVATAQRMVAALRPQDTVARVGGDEFVIVLETAIAQAAPTATAEVVHPGGPDADALIRGETLAIVERLVASLREPVITGEPGTGTVHTISASIGVTFAEPGSEPEQVLQEADSAMYRAKGAGRDRYAVFTSSHHAEAVERGHIEQSLRAALRRVDKHANAAIRPPKADPNAEDRGVEERGAAARGTERPATLSVVYQPVFDLADMRLIGVEALARLTDGYGLSLAPGAFIPVAEQSGQIARLGRAVLTTACHDLAEWHARFPAWRHVCVAVNLSARQAGMVDLVDLIDTALMHSGLAPSLLTLELTESVLLEASRSTIAALNTLHAQGVQLSIDDFGTGYASMSYLAQLPVSSVKVDKSFTAGLTHDKTCAVIVRAIATLAYDLGISCVVEGIETTEQLHALPAGVHGQGFLLGRPMAAAEVGTLLSTAAQDPRAESQLTARTTHVSPGAASQPAPADWSGSATTGPRHPQAAGHFRTELAIDREAAADERQDTADHRDQLADRRDVLADLREQITVQHEADLGTLLAGALHRDRLADLRDDQAKDRDLAARRREDDAGARESPDGGAELASTGSDRVHARMDRMHGARDRDAAAADRVTFLETRSNQQSGQRARSLVRTSAAATRISATGLRKQTRRASDPRGV